jgi:hypothetical protein
MPEIFWIEGRARMLRIYADGSEYALLWDNRSVMQGTFAACSKLYLAEFFEVKPNQPKP